MTSARGQMVSHRYRRIMRGWFSRYVQPVTRDPKPMLGGVEDHNSAASASHPNARPAYSLLRRCHASRIESKRKMRSYKATITGTVAIDSLQPMPSRQESIAADCHRSDVAARIAQYTVSR